MILRTADVSVPNDSFVETRDLWPHDYRVHDYCNATPLPRSQFFREQGPTFDQGRGISWLTTFVDGAPSLGWHDTLCYMSIPAILVVSQKLSMTLLTPPDDGPDDATGSSLKV